MYARDIMTRPVISIDTLGTVREAITLLTEHGFAAIPVVDAGGRVVGILSESDALRANASGAHRDALVTTAMTTPVEVIGPAADAAVMAERMLARHLRSMPVAEEGFLIGMVSRRDLLRMLVRDDDVITANVRGLLDDYAGSRRHWSVDVAGGAVMVSGDFADDAEKAIVAALARTVTGVTTVELTTTVPASIGWDDQEVGVPRRQDRNRSMVLVSGGARAASAGVPVARGVHGT